MTWLDDLAFWALDLRHPLTVEASGPPPHAESTPTWQHVRYEFPARGDAPPLTLTWTHGETAPARFRENQVPEWAWGVFVGSKGLLLANYDRRMLWPEHSFAAVVPPEPSLAPSVGHHLEWITACKTGSPTTCNFDYSGAVTETMLLGNVAYRVGQKLEWDATNMTCTNCPPAHDYLQGRTVSVGKVPVGDGNWRHATSNIGSICCARLRGGGSVSPGTRVEVAGSGSRAFASRTTSSVSIV